MTAQRGNKLLVKKGNGADPEVFTTIGALRTKGLQLAGNPINVTTDDDVDANDEIWNVFITGPKGMTISGDGIGKASNKAQLQAAYVDFSQGNLHNYEIVVPNLGTFTAAMYVTNMEFNGDYQDVITFTLELTLAQAPSFAAEP
ncbi:MAG: phage tail tube protein [Pseudomonadota bacterium]